MAKGSALALALGAGGGLALWYLFRDGDRKKPAPAVAGPAAPVAPAAPSPAPTACALRIDATGLTADGVRVGVAEAVDRCKRAGRADVSVSEDASAAAYADLMIALGRAGVSVHAHRDVAGPRNARRTGPRTVDEVDLPSFALMVQALAGDVEPDRAPDGRARGRFGARKVFIAAIRRALRATKYASLPRAAIDELLFRAHRERLLVLARADLVAVMDPDEVRDSELVTDGAQFHFVVDEPDATRNANTYRAFTLVTHTEGHEADPRRRYFRAEPPTTWADACDRLGAAGLLDRTLARHTPPPAGWILSVDPAHFRDELAEPLPGGGSDGE
jgi:hypothetical protein